MCCEISAANTFCLYKCILYIDCRSEVRSYLYMVLRQNFQFEGLDNRYLQQVLVYSDCKTQICLDSDPVPTQIRELHYPWVSHGSTCANPWVFHTRAQP